MLVRLFIFSLLLVVVIMTITFVPSHHSSLASQENKSPDGLWTRVSDVDIEAFDIEVKPQTFSTFTLNEDALRERLRRAPLESNRRVERDEVLITLPLPNGSYSRFRVEESPIMEPDLAAQYPQIKNYRGKGIDDPSADARLQFTPNGLRAMIMSDAGITYVEPARDRPPKLYLSFFKTEPAGQDDERQPEKFHCLVDSAKARRDLRTKRRRAKKFVSFAATDDKLRIYRMAVAATGEYVAAVHHPDNPANPDADLVLDALTAINNTISRVNLVYERELAVRLVLVANETKIIHTNAATDPYTNNKAAVDIAQNQLELDKTTVIGTANYDIGHVFTTGTGGYAVIQGVCDKDRKAKGTTGNATPFGDPFDVDYVAHELGHQFGANHSFNGSTSNCSTRNAKTAFEPASGTTIMGYSGQSNLCGAETISRRGDDYFHAISLAEINDYITTTDEGWGDSCPTRVSTGNSNSPVVSGGPDMTIPKLTPFILSVAKSSDADGDTLRYCWEQFQLGPKGPPNDNSDNKIRPVLRSRPPAAGLSRTFPRMEDLLSNTTGTFEVLPSIPQTLTFRVTARDMRGRFGFDNVDVVVASSGPFVVTNPQVNATWSRGSTQTISWNVAGTSAAPINCANVKISFIIDGDETHPLVVIGTTANDGSQNIIVPADLPVTNNLRVKVEAVGNIFFSISPGTITISGV